MSGQQNQHFVLHNSLHNIVHNILHVQIFFKMSVTNHSGSKIHEQLTKKNKKYLHKEPCSHTGRNTILDCDMVVLIVFDGSRLA